AGLDQMAPRAVDVLEPAAVAAGSLLHPAHDLRGVGAGADAAQSAARRSRAGQGDADHADHVQHLLPLLPGGPGALLGRPEPAVDRAAVVHQPHARGRSEGEGAALSTARPTIAAIATPAGRGGIGIVRVSGSRVREIALAITG